MCEIVAWTPVTTAPPGSVNPRFVAEIMNATLHKEVVLGQTIGPVTIPSVGLEGAYD